MALFPGFVGDDPSAIDVIDQAVKRPDGGNIGIHYTVGTVDIVNGARPAGNTADSAIRRLRKDRPDLHAQVLAKAISPHAAMVEAGFRRKTATVPVDDPDKVSAFIEERKSAQARAQAPKPLRESRRPTNDERANKVDVVNLIGGNSADYLTARIARDHPVRRPRPTDPDS